MIDDSIVLTLKEIIRERTSNETIDEVLVNRLKLENKVRKLKRLGENCGFEEGGVCKRIDIRCGERQQYAFPEDEDNRLLPHRCNYQPDLKIGEFYILIVDDDNDSLALFEKYFIKQGVRPDHIEKAENVFDAQEKLKEGKIKNHQYAVVLSDVKMQNGTGFELVNHLVDRNFNSRILLMSGCYDKEDFPSNYLGDKEVAQGQTIVSNFFTKPVSFAEFSSHVREIEKEFQQPL